MDVADILSYNAELANYVLDNPTESLPLVSSPLLDKLRRARSSWLVIMKVDPRDRSQSDVAGKAWPEM